MLLSLLTATLAAGCGLDSRAGGEILNDTGSSPQKAEPCNFRVTGPPFPPSLVQGESESVSLTLHAEGRGGYRKLKSRNVRALHP